VPCTAGGAVALLTVLAAAQMAPLGWHLLIPMAVLSGVLAAVGVLYHRACGRPLPAPAAPGGPTAPPRLALSEQDLEQLLQRFEQSYNLTPEDLGELLAAAEERPSSAGCPA
jgi:CBS domain-containing membrane protein